MARIEVAIAEPSWGLVHEATASWSRTDTVVLALVTTIAGAIRAFRVTAVSHRIFDEAYYAIRGCEYVFGDGPPCHARGLVDLPPVHPPLGTWMIALGIRVFGYRSGGWRAPSLAAGTLTVVLVYLLARKILRSTLAATVASGALAIDFLHFVHSRLAMLDVFVPFFGVAAFLFAVYDRDRPASRDSRMGGWRWGDRLRDRRWRMLAGLAAGAAVASKWSGLWFLIAVVMLTFSWEVAKRGNGGRSASVRRTILEEGPSIVVGLLVVPAIVYVSSYAGRLDGAILAWPWSQDSWVRTLLRQQRDMLKFHWGFDVPHVYGSPPWSWPLLKRPLVYDITVAGGRYREILAVGNPLAWWPALAALAYVAVRWLRRHLSNGEAVILAGFAAGWLPWLALAPARGTTFLFYLLPSVPFMCLALAYVAAAVARLRWGPVTIASYAVVLLVSFVFYYPLLGAVPVSADAWRARILFDDCDLQGVTLSGIRLPPGVTPPPDSPGPYPEATMRGGGPPEGWCWI